MNEEETLFSFLKEVEALAAKHAVTMEQHEIKHRGQVWNVLVKFGFPKVITLEVQSGKHAGVSRFGHQ